VKCEMNSEAKVTVKLKYLVAKGTVVKLKYIVNQGDVVDVVDKATSAPPRSACSPSGSLRIPRSSSCRLSRRLRLARRRSS